MNEIFVCSQKEMKNARNVLLHGLYLSMYGLVKNLSLPFANYLRYAVLRIFSKSIKSTKISDGVMIWFPWRVEIGKKSSLNQGVIVDGFGGVKIGEGVRIAAFTCINTADHLYDDPSIPIYQAGYKCSKVIIEDNVWIGNHVSINKGVTVATGVVIGSGAVVTRDIPQDVIVAGTPAKILRSRFLDATSAA